MGKCDTLLPNLMLPPLSKGSKPASIFKVVVLPQPEGPSKTKVSPIGNLKIHGVYANIAVREGAGNS